MIASLKPTRNRILAMLLLSAAVSMGSFAFAASPALANTPNPVAGSTKLDSVMNNADGTITVTIEGKWTWTSQPNCPQTRNGVGYQVAWFDGNTADPIGNQKSPDGVIYVGDTQDNIVHSLEMLGGSSADGKAFFDGVPSSYLTHNKTNSTPTKTDAAKWNSNCESQDPSTHTSSGTWGPISHTYPAGTTSITPCPVMYDPRGKSADSGTSNVGDITAGGKGHNADNSYEKSGINNACLASPASKFSVYVGYYDNVHNGTEPTFPSPWEGSPGVIYEGCSPSSSCEIDASAVRVVNNTASQETLGSVVVKFGSVCTYNGWPAGITVPAGGQVILTQTGNPEGGVPPECNPQAGFIDGSDTGWTGNCSENSNIIPEVDVTADATTTVLPDTHQILNTGGVDGASCGPTGNANESAPWSSIGNAVAG